METKTSKAVALLKDGRMREALAVFRTFRMGFSREERRTIQIASETLNGSGKFYQSLGINTDSILEEASRILAKKYLQSSIIK
jgi:hypothetical protein